MKKIMMKSAIVAIELSQGACAMASFDKSVEEALQKDSRLRGIDLVTPYQGNDEASVSYRQKMNEFYAESSNESIGMSIQGRQKQMLTNIGSPWSVLCRNLGKM